MIAAHRVFATRGRASSFSCMFQRASFMPGLDYAFSRRGRRVARPARHGRAVFRKHSTPSASLVSRLQAGAELGRLQGEEFVEGTLDHEVLRRQSFLVEFEHPIE